MHDDEDDTEDTVIRPRRRPTSPDPLGDTVLRSVDPPWTAAPWTPSSSTPVSSSPVSSTLDDDDTVMRAPRRPATGRRAAGAPDAPPSLPSVPVAARERVPSIRVGERRVPLDRPVVIGRRPSLPRIVQGPEPVLVTVPSPRGQVSSSHVLVHAEGDATVVQDLRSTNGTVVRPAGAAPYRMAAGASIVALTGTVVEIGDGNAIEILSPHLRATPPADGFPPPLASPPTQLTGTPRTPRERS